MFDKHKRESLLLRDLLKKLIIIVIGSIVAAYGITLALYAGFGGATLAVLWQGMRSWIRSVCSILMWRQRS